MPFALVPRHLIVLVALSCLTPMARALDSSGAKTVIDQFLRSQKLQQLETAEAAQHMVADVNGDGKPDIVLMWNVLGATWHQPKLTLFIDQGKTYRALATDLAGQTEKLSVNGSNIVVHTLMPGPNDPRCCPTRKTQNALSVERQQAGDAEIGCRPAPPALITLVSRPPGTAPKPLQILDSA
jgi:hypothetical protein